MEVRMMSNDGGIIIKVVAVVVVMMVISSGVESSLSRADYGDALSKSILFFEGQRSGKLPPTQRMKWRKDSALTDGHQIGVDLTGGYYDAGDNVKFNFPMAFSMTMLAWSVIEFGKPMGGEERGYAMEAIRWGTDYLLKSTDIPGLVFVQVGEPYEDHFCWERPEDMDTVRTPYAVSRQFPGSGVSAEIAAALASSSLAFKKIHPKYSAILLDRAIKVFEFADKYRGSYNEVLGPWVCPFYCDFSGYEDELLWAAAWLFKATRNRKYWKYLDQNMSKLDINKLNEFGWDSKHAGINVLMSKTLPPKNSDSSASAFKNNAEKFICSLLPESPTKAANYSPGGLLFKPGNSNLQHATTLSFLLIAYTRRRFNGTVQCGNINVAPNRLIQIAQNQVDYILGENPLKMSYMVGFGSKYPQKIHHRGSTLPPIDQHPEKIECSGGSSYFYATNPNSNPLTGAIVGGPDINDNYYDNRSDFVHSEPTTYINAPFVGVLAYFKSHPVPPLN